MDTSPVQDPKRPHVVIIGGGFAGLNAARRLGKAPVRVTLIDRNNYHLFQPLLYQVATAGLSPAEIAHPIRSVVRKQQNTEVLMGEVVGVDKEGRSVRLADGKTISYDYLVLATGSVYNYFGHEEWARFAPSLKTVTDATHIRRNILVAFEQAEMESDEAKRRALLTFVVVGGGPTGVEMAGAIAELAHRALASDFRYIDPQHTRILLVEAVPRILNAFPEHLAQRALEKLVRLGVEVRTNAMVQAVDEYGVVISGDRIDSPNVIWAAGVLGTEPGEWLGAETDRIQRVKVGPDLSVPGHPEIFVLGDTAFVPDPDGKPLPGVAPVAMQQGRYVADRIRARVEGHGGFPPFRYRDKGNLATVGRSFAIADFGRMSFGGFFAWLIWIVVHIVYLIDFQNRMLVLTQWAWSWFTFHRGARLIVREEPRQWPGG